MMDAQYSIHKLRDVYLIGVCLVLTTVFLWPSYFNGWVNWDDHGYVLNNHLVKVLSWSNFKETFTTLQVVGLYHPFTILSLAIDYQIGGDDPFIFHFTNNILHLINTSLVFVLMRLLTDRKDMSLIASMLFGFHPMHVESVAWISARKDVLYGCFLLLGLISYLYYLKRDKNAGMKFYYVTLGLFLLSMLAKATAMVFPFMLLLIDYLKKRTNYKSALLEKLPFFLISLGLGLIGILGQQESTALMEVSKFPFHKTFFVAMHSLVLYIINFFVPHGMSPFHPLPFHRVEFMPAYFYASIIPLAVLSYLVWKTRKYSREIIFGFGFLVISLGPLLQFLPVGRALIAERYTYIAYLGIFFCICVIYVWMNNKITAWNKNFQYFVPLIISAFLLYLGTKTYERTKIWEGGDTLWTDVIAKYPNDYFGYANRGDFWYKKGNYELALADFNHSIELFQAFPGVYNNRGRIYQKIGKPELAIQDFSHVIALDSTNDKALINRAILWLSYHNDADKAEIDLINAMRHNPTNHLAYLNLGVLYERIPIFDKADSIYTSGLNLLPRNHLLHQYRGLVRHKQGRISEAIVDYENSINIRSSDRRSFYLRSKAYYDLNQLDSARMDASNALKLGFKIGEDYLKLLNLYQ